MTIKVPVFLAAAHRDVVGLAAMNKQSTLKHCPNTTVVDFFDADHWVLLSHAENLNEEIDAWLKKVGIDASATPI